METSSALISRGVDLATKTYPAWIEVEIGLDAGSIALPWRARKKLFSERIESCLIAMEQAAPGIRAKLEVHPARPFGFTGSLSADDIRAIWNLPEVRMLSDKSETKEPTPDASGRSPYAVDMLQHFQAEESGGVEVERVTVVVKAIDEQEATRTALEGVHTMPEHFMGSDYRIHRRWWTIEHVSLNTLYDEERTRFGDAVFVDQTDLPKLKHQPKWRPDERIERVTYGSPKQRPKSWEWMIS